MSKILVDVYGADRGPSVVIEGAVKALEYDSDLKLVFFGEKNEVSTIIEGLKNKYSVDDSRYEIYDAPGKITNEDNPTIVFKGGEGTSMTEAFKYLKASEDADGMVSCGNTGSLLIGSIFMLGLEKGLKRPALASLLPTCDGKMICITDCGSNMDCKPEELLTFAKLGADLVTKNYGTERPKVGLLSVGRENHKGNILTLSAFELLSQSELNFVGNLEPDAIYTGEADVIVSDGFPGNILLKNTEATGHNILARIEKITKNEKDPHTLEVLGKIKEEIIMSHEFNSRGGAVFLGTKKIIVKGHGAATEDTVFACIKQIKV